MDKSVDRPVGPEERAKLAPQRYVLSDAVKQALTDAIGNLNREHIGVHRDVRSKNDSIRMAAAFKEALQTDESGKKLLGALDRLHDLSGTPALVISNFPNSHWSISNAALRMYQCYAFGEAHLPKSKRLRELDHTVRDNPLTPINPTNLVPVITAGNTKPHADMEDIAALLCVRPGEYKRPTVFYTASDWVDLLVKELEPELQDAEEHWKLREKVLHTLAQPLWQPSEAIKSSKQHYHASHGVTKTRAKGVPLIYANTAYDPSLPPEERGSPYCFVNHGFHEEPRLKRASLWKNYKKDDFAYRLTRTWNRLLQRQFVPGRTEVFLEQSEVLVFNNNAVMHAGGEYPSLEEPNSEKPDNEACRYIVAADATVHPLETRRSEAVSWQSYLNGRDCDKTDLSRGAQ